MTGLLSGIRRFVVVAANRLWAGRYRRPIAFVLGLTGAVVLSAIGFYLGPVIHPWIPVTLGVSFRTGELQALWAVHATVISLSLVALSFAWNSLQDLPTVRAVIEEFTYQLRSIEIITFLLTANLCIGYVTLLSEGEFVPLNIGYASGLLLVVSFAVTLRGFWTVLKLLLYNTLDETVGDLAQNVVTGKFGLFRDDYMTYLAHFFHRAREDIDNDRPEELGDRLDWVKELLEVQLWEGVSGEDENQVWQDTLSNIVALHRRSIKQQSEDLEKQTISALHSIVLTAVNFDRLDLTAQSLQAYAQVFQHEYSVEPKGNTVEYLLIRFEELQNWIFGEFERAEDEHSLGEITELVDTLLQTHASLWKASIENEARGAMGYLHYLLEDVYQFRPYTYSEPFPPHVSSDAGADDTEFLERKQEHADTFRDAITQLRFVTYAWALNLYRDNDLSQRFVELIFGEYVESDFDSVSDLSAVYFELVEEEGIMTYWERWNMDRALDETHGVATTGAAVNTWLLEFYCSALVWILDSEEVIERVAEREEEQSPITEYDRMGSRVDEIMEILESYESNYPLAEIGVEKPSIEKRCEVLIDYFTRIKDLLDEQEQQDIRQLPIDPGLEDKFAEAVNSQLDSVQLRTGLEMVAEITQVEKLDEEDSAGFTLPAIMARRLFVDDGVPTFFSSSFANVLNQYRDFVIDQLELQERELETIDELPNALADIAEANDVAVFVVDIDEASDVLREDDRSERSIDNETLSFYNFAEIPVLPDSTTDYVAVAIIDDGFEYVEQGEHPFTVTVTPGEQVEDWSEKDTPEGKVPEDYVRADVSYRARIRASKMNGVVFRFVD